MLSFIAWWVISEIFGLAALPLARRIFAWLPDRGYAFSKTMGLLLVSYLLWLGAITGVLVNDWGGILLALLLVSGLSLWAALPLANVKDRLRGFWQNHHGQILAVEALFLLAFAGWALVRAYAPDKILPAGGEKYMEIAFLNGVLNSPHFPPLDPWMSGYAISYYYFGYVMMGVMTRFSGAAPTVGFDLYDALTFALTAVTAYGMVSNMVLAGRGSRRQASGFGLLGALFVVGMGNLEGLLEGLYSNGTLPASFWQWIDIPDLAGSAQGGSFFPGIGWWWWRASRVLHDLDLAGKPVAVQPIDEFPLFSFLLGDNHPHKLALPFVLLVIGLALNLLLRACDGGAEPEEPARAWAWPQWRGWLWKRRGEAGLFLFTALALGALAFLNTWDFPIYLAVVLLAYAVGRVLGGEAISLRLGVQLLALAVGLGVGAIGLYVFFYLSFASQAGGVLPYVFAPTRLPQYLVMFGPFIFILAFFCVGVLVRSVDKGIALLQALRTWLWTIGLIFAGFVLVLLLSLAALRLRGLESDPFIQTWLNGATPAQALGQVLVSRVQDPWLFLALSGMIAIIVTVGMRRKEEEDLTPDPFPRREGARQESRVPTKEQGEGKEVKRDLTPQPPSLGGKGEQEKNLPSFVSLEGNPSYPIKGEEEKNLPSFDPLEGTPSRLGKGPGVRFSSSSDPATLFALVLAFTGIALTLVVEFFYLRDNFGVRMNTIFKFYYQGWVMMACASAYGAWWVARYAGRAARAAALTGLALLVAAGLAYPLMGVYSRDEAFAFQPDMDAAATFAGVYPDRWAAQPDDWAAIQWLIKNGRQPDGGVPVILEAGSGGYENAGRIAAFTGFPSILGWTNHEGQWRGNYDEISKRQPVIQKIFITTSSTEALDLLHQWNVRYVVIGNTELSYVVKQCQEAKPMCNPNQALGKFQKMLKPVFSQGATTVYQVP